MFFMCGKILVHLIKSFENVGITPFVPGAVYPGRGALDKRRVAPSSVLSFIQVLRSGNF